MHLTAFVGAPVVQGRNVVGEVADVGAAPGPTVPVVTGVVVRRRGQPAAWAPWSAVARVDGDGIRLESGAELEPVIEPVLLARDVLDAQIVDLAGHRVVRVGDVDLCPTGRLLQVVGVEVGLDAVLRRLGLGRLARRAPRRRIAWSDLHLPSHPGGSLSLVHAAHVLHRPPRYPTHALRRRRRSQA